MKRILCMLCIVLTLSVAAQKVEVPTAPPEKKALVADETEVVRSGEKKFRIITSNDEISAKMLGKFKPSILVSLNGAKRTVKYKGKPQIYWEYSYYFNNEDYNTVMMFVKGGFK